MNYGCIGNYHEPNIDWILSLLKEICNRLDYPFINFAGAWNINSLYNKGDVVSTADNKLYIANNTIYPNTPITDNNWVEIADFGNIISVWFTPDHYGIGENNFPSQISGNIAFPAGNYKLTQDTIFKKQVVFAEGAILDTAGFKVTFEQEILAGPYEIFENSTGTITIYNNVLYPEWFGADGTGNRDSLNSVQKCIDCLPEYGGTIYFHGRYFINGTLTISKNFVKLQGNTVHHRQLYPNLYNNLPQETLLINGGENVFLEDMTIGKSAPNEDENSIAVKITGGLAFHAERCGFGNARTSVQVTNQNGAHFVDCEFTNGVTTSLGYTSALKILNNSGDATSGIVVERCKIYGNNVSNSYGIYDVSNGATQAGDRTYKNIEVAGKISYAMYISIVNSGFDLDNTISGLISDECVLGGIYLNSDGENTLHNYNIDNIWIRTSTDGCNLLNINNYPNVNINSATLNSAIESPSNANALTITDSVNINISNLIVIGNRFTRILFLTNVSSGIISNFLTRLIDGNYITDCNYVKLIGVIIGGALAISGGGNVDQISVSEHVTN